MICRTCNNDKPHSEYYSRTNGSPERVCKVCRRSRKDSNPNNKANAKRYRDANRDACNARVRAHQKANPDYYNALNAQRRATKVSATFGDPEAIAYVYHAAQVVADVYGGRPHVDHIVPLQGALVSGLHAPQNLQLLSASQNVSKSNTHTP
jgi:hypothetical protein